MARIGDYSSTTNIIRYMQDIQTRVHDAQVSVTSEKKAQTYMGYSGETQRLINLENTVSLTERYKTSNENMLMRMSITEIAYGGAESTIREFRQQLDGFIQGSMTDENAVNDIQDWAFRALKDMESYLNTDIDGQYIFAGTRKDTPPVDFGLTTLADFQTKWDGGTIQYPTRASNHTSPRLTGTTGFPTDPTAQGYGTMTFTAGAGGQITASNAGAFANIPVGATFTLDSTSNDGTFTVAANNGTTITVAAGETIAAEAASTTAIMAPNTSYYDGDTNSTTHRVDENRTIDLGATAISPAFEKAIRAMSIIAQGDFGTAGGLDQNTGRAEEAYWLLSSSLDEPVTGTPPYGTADVNTGNLSSLGLDLGFNMILLKDTNERFERVSTYLTNHISDIENVNMAEAVARLMDESRALEAAYQAFAKIQTLSLGDYLA
ncbi:MAG: flagellin [Rhodospirillales bacterium]|nr:flagellin [Rhodospirillales bacterium]